MSFLYLVTRTGRVAALFLCLFFVAPLVFAQGNGNSGGGSTSGGGGIPPELAARLDQLESNIQSQLEAMEAAAEVRIAALESNLIASAEARIAALEAELIATADARINTLEDQLDAAADNRIDGLLTELAGRLDAQDAHLETIVGNTTTWPALTASLCLDLGTSRGFDGSLSLTAAEVEAEGGGGIDFYGNKAMADAQAKLGVDAEASGGFSVGLTPSACIELPAFELDGVDNPVPTSLTSAIAALEDYRDGFKDVAGEAANAFTNFSSAAATGVQLVTSPSFSTDPSALAASASATMTSFASMFPIPDELEDLMANPMATLAEEPDLCAVTSLFPAGSAMRQKVDELCASPSDPKADLEALLGIQDVISEIDMVTSESAPAMIADLVTKVDANASTLAGIEGGVTGLRSNLDFQFSTDPGALRWQIDRNLNTDLGGVRSELLQVKDKVFRELNNDIRSAQSQIVNSIRDAAPWRLATDDGGVDVESLGLIDLKHTDDEAISRDDIPQDFELESAYPNPFNPRTTVRFALPTAENVTITLFDITGRKIQTLVSGRLEAGYHTVNVDASRLASGTYFYRMEAGGYVGSRQMQLLK